MSRLKPNTDMGGVDYQARHAMAHAAARANRRRAMPRWLELTHRYGVRVGLSAASLGSLLWLWQAGWISSGVENVRNGFFGFTAQIGFAINDVLVEGRVESGKEMLLRSLRVRRGDPILEFSPTQARAELERLPWVAEAAVERRLPDTIFIRITERQPMALWQHDRKLVVIDRNGSVLSDQQIDHFTRLLIVVGPDAPARTPGLLTQLKLAPNIAKRVEAAVWVGGRRWDLRLDNGIDVRLPEADIVRALQVLEDLVGTKSLLDRDVVAVDLRLPDRLIVQTSAESAQKRRPPEKPGSNKT
ncbi:cell division protein FtsQ [Azospirillaceae bacterium]